MKAGEKEGHAYGVGALLELRNVFSNKSKGGADALSLNAEIRHGKRSTQRSENKQEQHRAQRAQNAYERERMGELRLSSCKGIRGDVGLTQQKNCCMELESTRPPSPSSSLPSWDVLLRGRKKRRHISLRTVCELTPRAWFTLFSFSPFVGLREDVVEIQKRRSGRLIFFVIVVNGCRRRALQQPRRRRRGKRR